MAVIKIKNIKSNLQIIINYGKKEINSEWDFSIRD